MAKARGSGNNNRGNNNPPPDDDDDDDGGGGNGGLDDATRDEIRRLVNATVSSQLGRKLDTAIKGALDGAMAPISEQLAKLTAARGDDDDDDDAPPTKKGGKGADRGDRGNRQQQRDPEFVAMQKKLQAIEEERKTERAQAEARERDSFLREQLGKLGVDQNRMRGAVAVLRESVKKDPETGDWIYKAQRDGYVEDLDLSKGVAEWGNTDEGKSYRTPPGKGAGGNNGQQRQQGAGGGQVNVIGTKPNGGNNSAAQKKEQDAAANQQRKAEAVDKLANAVNSLVGGANIDVG